MTTKQKRHPYLLVGLSSNQPLSKNIAKKLNMELTKVHVSKFADGEILVKSDVPVRNKNIIIVQSTSKPVNDTIMELLIAIDSFKRASAKSINVIIPYFGYARQDRKTLGREPITSKIVAKLLETIGANHISIIDIHSDQQQGFFDIPVDTLTVSHLLMNEIFKKSPPQNTVVVAPDYGGVKKSRKISDKYNIPLVILDKRRPRPNEAEIVSILGDVKNKNCVIYDDMIDTGGTIIAACKILKEKGAKNIIIAASHGIFSGNADEKINDAIKQGCISSVYVTNSIASVYDSKIKNLKIVDLAPYLAKVIGVLVGETENNSISDLYGK